MLWKVLIKRNFSKAKETEVNIKVKKEIGNNFSEWSDGVCLKQNA